MFQRMLDDVNPRVAAILDGALEGREMSVEDAELLLGVEGADQHALLWAADRARQEDVGDDVSYVICRNVNFTNICYVGCSFLRLCPSQASIRRLRPRYGYGAGEMRGGS